MVQILDEHYVSVAFKSKDFEVFLRQLHFLICTRVFFFVQRIFWTRCFGISLITLINLSYIKLEWNFPGDSIIYIFYLYPIFLPDQDLK